MRLLRLTTFAVLALLACKRPGAAADAGPEGPTLIGAEGVFKVERAQLQSGPRISGSLEARKQAVIRAEVSGAVTQVKAELGEAVKEGQLLARIEDNALKEGFSSAESSVRSMEQDALIAQRQLERVQTLVDAGAMAPRDLELAQSAAAAAAARRDDARARMAGSRKQVDSATVTAPFAGVVAVRAVNAGDVVSPGALLFTVIDPSTMRLTASVPSEQVGAIAIGREVQFEVRGYPGQTFTGVLERIAPMADAATRQITVLVSIPNPGGRLIAGLFAEGRIASVTREALVVPYDAVDTAGTKPKVLRVKDGKVEQAEVELGLRDDRTERVEVTAGLQPGDLVLIGAARTVAPGTEVQVAAATPPSQQG